MNSRKDEKKPPPDTLKGDAHGRIVAAPNKDQGLATVQLNHLEPSFRSWAEDSVRVDVRLARGRF